jgi:hypothetical protein
MRRAFVASGRGIGVAHPAKKMVDPASNAQRRKWDAKNAKTLCSRCNVILFSFAFFASLAPLRC